MAHRLDYVSTFFATQTAQSDLSLFSDRDIGKWKANPQQAQKRRELFFELVTYDSWQVSFFKRFFFSFHTLTFFIYLQSLTYGRPPSLSTAHIDNQMPHPTTKDENGNVEMSCRLSYVSPSCTFHNFS